MEKLCSWCAEVKDETEFSPCKSNSTGRHAYCKSCRSEYNSWILRRKKFPPEVRKTQFEYFHTVSGQKIYPRECKERCCLACRQMFTPVSVGRFICCQCKKKQKARRSEIGL